ncbi:allophanate hydrolase [Aurantimonas sp. 22II-16-19i]|uniref:allophanate hydrolase n=1 Tax=Aurantimonas sp. 22II-16-19i TaxID=1317114 RepID=UPI0009F7E74C|nr:allophanate hydrolase [Aurantimonas sp. 22II-16-19i]ORE98167.1 allophanate hydrolase [Aurantimonas sp. 22II-16-19i]
MTDLPTVLDFASLSALYAAGTTPAEVMAAVADRMESCDPAAFIARRTRADILADVEALLARAPEPNSLPLWGMPFAVKDNIDVAGLPTTAGCPDYAYHPAADATVVKRLREAGAILIGKTNLDQFATGLNGTRSPYGAPRCVFDASYVSGGSSSGSAVVVAAGVAAFALGTDTAGSGRVPAAFNNIVGIKPSPGRVSTTGVVPACRSIDVVTVFAASVADGMAARRIAEGFDPADAYARRFADEALPRTLRIGVPGEDEREFFGNDAYRALYDAAIERAEALGATIVTFDYRPFREAAALLYEGPWVAERLAAIEPFLNERPDSLDPTVRRIIEGGRAMTAADAFRGAYRLEALRREAEAEWAKVDGLMLPTSPDIQTVAAMRADPVALNARFGRFTNFANFFGCAAIAVPAGFTEAGLPFGVQLVAPRDTDEALGAFAAALHQAAGCGAGLDRGFAPPAQATASQAEDDRLQIAVVGAHLAGMVLNHELTGRGASFVRAARTAADYRLFALDTSPPKPGLVREPGFGGAGIAVEIWSLGAAAFGDFVAAIPAPLGIGKLALDDGSSLPGFICEPAGLAGASEITAFGGWKNYLTSRNSGA